MNVHEYLDDAANLPWRWGGGFTGFEGHDCTLFVAGWPIALGYADPGAGIRGTYRDEAEAASILSSHGGMASFIGKCLGQIGWHTENIPMDGDIGVVIAPLAPLGVRGEIAAIRAGELWVIRTLHGQRASSFPHLALWRP